MKDLIKNKFKEFGFELSEKQIEQFSIYFNFLLEENQKFNLTAITMPEEIIVKHFIDSILTINNIKDGASVIDVGTGAGFPGVPIKIMREDIKLVLLDSLQKRVNFLKELVSLLKLDNVECVHFRVEDYAKEHREKFDYAISRAVAVTSTLSEYLIPLIKVGGQAIMYKGQKAEEELSQSQKAITILGGKFNKISTFDLKEYGFRKIIFIDKINKTDKKYPRGKNLPKTNPIL